MVVHTGGNITGKKNRKNEMQVLERKFRNSIKDTQSLNSFLGEMKRDKNKGKLPYIPSRSYAQKIKDPEGT